MADWTQDRWMTIAMTTETRAPQWRRHRVAPTRIMLPADAPPSLIIRLVPYQLASPTMTNLQNHTPPIAQPTVTPLITPTLRAADRHRWYLKHCYVLRYVFTYSRTIPAYNATSWCIYENILVDCTLELWEKYVLFGVTKSWEERARCRTSRWFTIVLLLTSVT